MEEQSLRTKRLFGIVLLTLVNAGFVWLLSVVGYFAFAIIVADFDFERALAVTRDVDKEVALKALIISMIVLLMNDPILRFLVKVRDPIRWNGGITLIGLLIFVPIYLSFRSHFLEYHREQTAFLHELGSENLNREEVRVNRHIILPDSENALVVFMVNLENAKKRTLKKLITKGYLLGFKAFVDFYEETDAIGVKPKDFKYSKLENYKHSFVFLIDEQTATDPEHPIICVDLAEYSGKFFRVIPSEMWVVENNLSISNMTFDEFYSSCDKDGVYRAE